MYTITINNYSKFYENYTNNIYLSKNVDFSTDLDEFLCGYVVSDRIKLLAVRGLMLHSILHCLHDHFTDELVTIFIRNTIFPMRVRTTVYFDCALIELSHAELDMFMYSINVLCVISSINIRCNNPCDIASCEF